MVGNIELVANRLDAGSRLAVGCVNSSHDVELGVSLEVGSIAGPLVNAPLATGHSLCDFLHLVARCCLVVVEIRSGYVEVFERRHLCGAVEALGELDEEG